MAHYKVYIRENDQLGEASRLVTLRGTGTTRFYFYPTNSAEARFIDDGWDLVAFDLQRQTWSASGVTFNISARVNNNFTGEDARQRAIYLLDENYSNINLVIEENQPTTIDASGKVPYIPSSGGKDDSNSFLPSLGLALGTSTPIVIGGLLILGVILLKR